MPLPLAKNRKYVHMTEYRGYTIATYKDPLDEPVYSIGKVPVFAVYFALDEFGDVLTPVDTCFWSPFLAMAFIDQYVALTEHERKLYWKQQGAWPMLHQNYNAQHILPRLVDSMRNIAAECTAPDLDVWHDSASEYGAEVEKRIKKAIEYIYLSPKPKGEDDIFATPE
jgi:hypothetical protein